MLKEKRKRDRNIYKENYEDRKSGKPVSTIEAINKETTTVDAECCECQTSNPIEAKFCMNCGEGLGEKKDG